jgi:hypothetical protein
MGTVKDHFHGGSFDDAEGADTIAGEIFSALAQVRLEAGITQPLPTGQNAQQMNILFAAIGRGILKHLSNHPQAIQLAAGSGAISVSGYANEIDVSDT